MRFLLFSIWLISSGFLLAATSPERMALTPFCLEQGLTLMEQGATNIVFRKGELSFLCYSESRRVSLQGVQIWLNAGVEKKESGWTLHTRDAGEVLAPILTPKKYLREPVPRRVVIDPGHGGEDSGAEDWKGRTEKVLTMDIARRVISCLTSNGIKAVLTRKNDTGMSLTERAARVKALHADLMVSIHLNSSSNPDAEGVETYLLPLAGFSSTSQKEDNGNFQLGNAQDEKNSILAFLVQRSVLQHAKAMDRGVKRARFVMLNEAACPAALIECGFLSNRKEAEQLNTEAYRQKLAEGISAGIKEYIRLSRPSPGRNASASAGQ